MGAHALQRDTADVGDQGANERLRGRSKVHDYSLRLTMSRCGQETDQRNVGAMMGPEIDGLHATYCSFWNATHIIYGVEKPLRLRACR